MQTHFTSTQLNSDSTNKTTVHFFTLHFMLNLLQRSHGREDNAHSNVILPFGTTQNFSLSNKHSRNCGASENGYQTCKEGVIPLLAMLFVHRPARAESFEKKS
jgi:hypothetical protein